MEILLDSTVPWELPTILRLTSTYTRRGRPLWPTATSPRPEAMALDRHGLAGGTRAGIEYYSRAVQGTSLTATLPVKVGSGVPCGDARDFAYLRCACKVWCLELISRAGHPGLDQRSPTRAHSSVSSTSSALGGGAQDEAIADLALARQSQTVCRRRHFRATFSQGPTSASYSSQSLRAGNIQCAPMQVDHRSWRQWIAIICRFRALLHQISSPMSRGLHHPISGQSPSFAVARGWWARHGMDLPWT